MPTYITQGRYSREAIQGMIKSPEDRSKAVAKLIKAAGGKLVSYYVTFGEYDFLPDRGSARRARCLSSCPGGCRWRWGDGPQDDGRDDHD